MTEDNFVDRLVEDFKSGVDVIHGHYIKSRRTTHKSRLISSADIPVSVNCPIYTLDTNLEDCAYARCSPDEISHPQNQRERALSTTELRRITRETLAQVDHGTEFTEDQDIEMEGSNPTDSYESVDRSKLFRWRTYSSTGSSEELFLSRSTSIISQDWETETLCSPCRSCYSDPGTSHAREPPFNSPDELSLPAGLDWRDLPDGDRSSSSMRKSRKKIVSRSLSDLCKPRLRRVARVSNLYHAANGVPMTNYQEKETESYDVKQEEIIASMHEPIVKYLGEGDCSHNSPKGEDVDKDCKGGSL